MLTPARHQVNLCMNFPVFSRCLICTGGTLPRPSSAPVLPGAGGAEHQRCLPQRDVGAVSRGSTVSGEEKEQNKTGEKRGKGATKGEKEKIVEEKRGEKRKQDTRGKKQEKEKKKERCTEKRGIKRKREKTREEEAKKREEGQKDKRPSWVVKGGIFSLFAVYKLRGCENARFLACVCNPPLTSDPHTSVGKMRSFASIFWRFCKRK